MRFWASGPVLRLACRLAALAAAAAALAGALPWPEAPAYVAGVSPFVAACAALAGRSLRPAMLLAAAVAAACLLRPRWFCRWTCPVGLLVDGCSRLTSRRVPARVPQVGRWIAWATLAGAIVGYPLLLWLDPLAMLSAAAGVGGRWPAALAGVVPLAAVLVLSALAGPLWCARLCPLGAAQDLLAWPRRAWDRHPSGLEPRDAQPHAPSSARRAFLAGLASCAAGLAAGAVLRRRATAGPPLRPPGAIEEAHFTGLCIRCGDCIRTCPTGILRADLGEGRTPAGWLAPIVRFDDGYCREDCNRCTRACPSGAIRHVDLPAKRLAIIGLAKVDLGACLLANGQECTVCIRACPYEAISSRFDEADYSTRPVLDLRRCNGCGACEAACPVRPVRAVRVHPASSRRMSPAGGMASFAEP